MTSSNAVGSHTVSIEEMQRIDERAIHELGIPRLLLMEHAGLAVAKAVREHLGGEEGTAQRVVVCCGLGHNGGDGLCAARHLKGWGYRPEVVVCGTVSRLKEEAAVYAGILRAMDVPIVEWQPTSGVERLEQRLREAALVIDAVLGIGLRDAVRPPIADVIEAMNRSGTPIVSVDVPSGLDANTGRPRGSAVKATVTVTFGLPKHGCRVEQGPAHVGRLLVDAISIPQTLLREPARRAGDSGRRQS